jgi:hypothetical protein
VRRSCRSVVVMSKVNRTMFGAGLDEEGAAGAGEEGSTAHDNAGSHFNITQATLEQLTRVGLAKEVVRQGDGTEYEMGTDGRLNDERTFSMLGKDVSDDELREAGFTSTPTQPLCISVRQSEKLTQPSRGRLNVQ